MKITLLFLLAGLITVSACKEPNEVAPNEDVAALQEKFHGKYKPLYSTSSQALDVNRDGKASTDMLEEISELPDMVVEVRIYDKSQYNAKPSFLFTHHWPKQWFGRVEPINFDPSIKVSYDRKVVSWEFAFDNALTQLLLEPNESYLADPDLYTPLKTVLVKNSGQIEVTLTKRLYTPEGWKTVQIVTLYERFTRIT